MPQETDILIVGAGLVGAALGAALADSGYRIVVLDQTHPVLLPETELDSRIYAISPGSRQFLEACGAWAQMDARRIAAIRQMVIAEQGQTQNLTFSAVEADVDELAVIVESNRLQMALWQCLQDAGNITCLTAHTIQSVTVQPDKVIIGLTHGKDITARLLVGADGARSLIRANIGGGIRQYDYQQYGVVANFSCEKPHNEVAYQWFCPNGILAWLPLPDNHISMVWSADVPLADELRQLDAKALANRVAIAGNHQLGALTQVGNTAAFPLRLTHVPRWVSERIALVGDAAHTVHPLAGQGVNLGFGDVAVLVRLLLTPGADPGQLRLLRRYERERREAVYAMQGVTHALQKLFRPSDPLLKTVRQWGLYCTDRLGTVKRQLIKAALT